MSSELKQKTVSGFIWRLLQNISSHGISFVIQIILARILLPEDYGVTTIITVFLTIANVFINTGFSSALIQKKDLTEVDLSSAFYSGMLLSFGLYGVLFVSAPYIASYYEMPLLSPMLRVQSLSVIFGALCSVQQSVLTKHMQFRKSMIASMSASIVQGVVGIVLALNGLGAWSLVLSYLAGNIVTCIVLWLVVKWKPKLVFSIKNVQRLLSFSIKVLGLNLINTLYNNLKSLIIGKAYDETSLAYYNRGYQFPSLVMSNVDGAMTTVLFSSLSKLQDDEKEFMRMLRKSMRMSLYVCSPIMLGMFVVAEPMVLVLLTDKWIESVPFVQLSCLICLMWPMSAITHAVIAKGKSSTALILNIVTKMIGICFLMLSLRFGVYAFVMSGLFSSIICRIISAFVYKQTLTYSIRNQLFDIVSPMWRAVLMAMVIYPINLLNIPPLLKLVIMLPVGGTIYIILSLIVKSEEFASILGMLKKKFLKQ